MSDSDTIRTWMFIGSCLHHAAEKLIITKKK